MNRIARASEIDFYTDTMIVEMILKDPAMLKKASIGSVISSLLASFKNYIASHVDPNNKVKSYINILAPTAIMGIGSVLGFPIIGMLFGAAASAFNIDVASALEGIYEQIKSMIMDGKEISAPQVDSIVSENIQSNYTPLSPEQEEEAKRKLSQKSAQTIRDARVVKLALIQCSDNIHSIRKFAFIGSALVAVIKTVIGWLFKVALKSIGFMGFGDVARSFMGETTGPATQTSQPAPIAYVAKQTKFKLNPSYNIASQFSGQERVQRYMNTPEGIGNMLVEFANDVYSGLQGLDGAIKSTAGFKAVVDAIAWHNHTAKGDSVVFIPDAFTSKKQIVDRFIDDVAAKTPQTNAYKNI